MVKIHQKHLVDNINHIPLFRQSYSFFVLQKQLCRQYGGKDINSSDMKR